MLAEVFFEDLGYQSYRTVWDYQEVLLQQNTQLKAQGKAESTRHHLLLVKQMNVNCYKQDTTRYDCRMNPANSKVSTTSPSVQKNLNRNNLPIATKIKQVLA